MTRAEYNSFVMNQYLADNGSMSFDRFDDAVHGRLRPPTRDGATAARNRDIDARNMAAALCRLEIMVPPRPSDSWVGGEPSLPPEVEWPHRDGKPLAFYAQIAARDIPAETWGGMGPRDGWLLVFAPIDAHGDAVVLHTTSRGTPRQRPASLTFRHLHFGTYEERAEAMMGAAALQPPRWPVRIVPSQGTARPAKTSVFHQIHATPPTLGPGWQPFDWPSLVAFVTACRAHAAHQTRKPSGSVRENFAALWEEIDAHAAPLLAQLDALAERLQRRAASQPFDPRLRDDVTATMSRQRLLTRARSSDGSYKAELVPLLPAHEVLKEYLEMHELHARHLYTSDPASLPDPVRAVLEPLWRNAAEQEVITLGGNAVRFEQYGVANILELVPSHLFGWTFGDWSNWACLIRDDDMYDGRLDRAFCVDNHGL